LDQRHTSWLSYVPVQRGKANCKQGAVQLAELDEEECDAKQGIAAAGMSAANLNFRHFAALH